MLRAVWSALLLVLLAGCAMAVETPRYESELQEGPIEVRRYAPLLAAEVRVSGERTQAVNQGFRLLADYIFGANSTAQKVAMTAPVTQSKPEKIAMTAPVTQQSAGEENVWTVRFIMPSQYTRDTIPKPLNEAVVLVEEPPQRFAAIRFSGFAEAAALERKEKALRDFLVARRLEPAGSPVYAYYDPPWTLPFLRRNEILIPLS